MEANNSLAPKPQNDSKGALVKKFAGKYGVDHNQLGTILKNTAFRLPADRNNGPQEVTNEQMAALLIVADQYGLNPFTKEIYAFPDKSKGIVPIVGVDGWTRIMNEHPQFDGLEFKYSENIVQADKDANPCPEWIEVVIYRKDRSRPIVIREYLEECYRPKMGNFKGPWQSHTRRFLRHKALIQGARTAFGFSGIYEEDEAERIASARVVNMERDMPKAIDISGNSKKETPSTTRSAADGFFDQDATDAQPVNDSDVEPETPPEEPDAEALLGEDYLSLSAADRKKALFEWLRGYDITEQDMTKLVGKGYGQWTKKDRQKLADAYAQLANGTDPGEVFA